jgi:hypothetical protein
LLCKSLYKKVRKYISENQCLRLLDNGNKYPVINTFFTSLVIGYGSDCEKLFETECLKKVKQLIIAFGIIMDPKRIKNGKTFEEILKHFTELTEIIVMKIDAEHKLEDRILAVNSFPKINSVMLHGIDEYNYTSDNHCGSCKGRYKNPWEFGSDDDNDCYCFYNFTLKNCKHVSQLSLLNHQRFQFGISGIGKNIKPVVIVADIYEKRNKPKTIICPNHVEKLYLENIKLALNASSITHIQELYIHDFMYSTFDYDAHIITVAVLKKYKHLKKLHMTTNGFVTKSAIKYMKEKGIEFTYNIDYVQVIKNHQQSQMLERIDLLDE